MEINLKNCLYDQDKNMKQGQVLLPWKRATFGAGATARAGAG
jgi:hypothetical protein